MLAVPVFHAHPGADHDHGESGHSYGGIVHTIFSPDVGGEDDRHHTHEGVGHSGPGDLAISDHPSHSLDNDEFAFTFLGSSTERKFFNPIFLHLFMVQPSASLEPPPNLSVVAQHYVVPPPLTVLTCDIPSRAPPPHQFI
jgi:hypothetical protein